MNLKQLKPRWKDLLSKVLQGAGQFSPSEGRPSPESPLVAVFHASLHVTLGSLFLLKCNKRAISSQEWFIGL